MSMISFAEMKVLVLSRIDGKIKDMPLSEKMRPQLIINFHPYTYLELKSQIERGTEDGKLYVYQEATKLGYAVSG